MSNKLFPEFFMQCCDADNYLDLGETCALASECYGSLRPGGAYYWFSWPARLGFSNYEPAGLAVTVMACAVFAEAIIIVPEQRFCIAFMIVVWILAAGYVLTLTMGPTPKMLVRCNTDTVSCPST